MKLLLKKVPIQLSAGIAVLLAMAALLTGIGLIVSQAVESTFRSEVEHEQQAFLDYYSEQIDAKLNISRAALESVARQVTLPLYEDGNAAQSFLDAQAALHSIFDNGLFLVANDGRIVAESPFLPAGRNRNISNLEFFQTPTRTQQPYISRPYASEHAADRPAVIIVIPVFDEQGAMIGRLLGGFELLTGNFLGSLPETVVGKKGYMYLVDDNRTVIVHPDRSRILGLCITSESASAVRPPRKARLFFVATSKKMRDVRGRSAEMPVFTPLQPFPCFLTIKSRGCWGWAR